MFATWTIANAVAGINTDLAPLFAVPLVSIIVLTVAGWAFVQVRKFGMRA